MLWNFTPRASRNRVHKKIDLLVSYSMHIKRLVIEWILNNFCGEFLHKSNHLDFNELVWPQKVLYIGLEFPFLGRAQFLPWELYAGSPRALYFFNGARRKEIETNHAARGTLSLGLALEFVFSAPMQFSWVLLGPISPHNLLTHRERARLLLMKTQRGRDAAPTHAIHSELNSSHFHCCTQSNLRTKPVVDLIVGVHAPRWERSSLWS